MELEVSVDQAIQHSRNQAVRIGDLELQVLVLAQENARIRAKLAELHVALDVAPDAQEPP